LSRYDKLDRMKLFASITGRIVAYLGVFTAGTVAIELIHEFIKSRTPVPGLLTLGVLIVAGLLFICRPHIQSRVTSGATLLLLGAIALRIDNSIIPTAYLLVGALLIATIGALPLFHKSRESKKRTILWSLAIVAISLIIFVLFSYGITVLTRMSFVG
jgi:hypothetical protein